MKKIIALVVGVLFALQSGVAFAAATSASPSIEPGIRTLLAFNRWLYGNNFYGVSYVNDNLAQAYTQALKWDGFAQLAFVDISYQEPGQIFCSFEFGSSKKANEVFKAECVNLLKKEKMAGEVVPVTLEVNPDSLFDAPVMKLRKFVSDVMVSADMLNQFRNYMGGSSQANVEFTLMKRDGTLRWNWGVSDGRELGMSIYADAGQLNSPLVFEGQ